MPKRNFIHHATRQDKRMAQQDKSVLSEREKYHQNLKRKEAIFYANFDPTAPGAILLPLLMVTGAMAAAQLNHFEFERVAEDNNSINSSSGSTSKGNTCTNPNFRPFAPEMNDQSSTFTTTPKQNVPKVTEIVIELPCKHEALAAGSSEGNKFMTNFGRHFPHPGTYVLPGGIAASSGQSYTNAMMKTYTKLLKTGAIHNQMSEDEQTSVLLPYVNKVYKTYTIDGTVDDKYPLDRVNYNKACDFVERQIIPENLGLWKPHELITTIAEINKILTSEKDPWHYNIPVIIRKVPSSVPGFSNMSGTIEYLKQHDLANLPQYTKLAKMLVTSYGSEAISDNRFWNLVIGNSLGNNSDIQLRDFLDKYYRINNLSEKEVKTKLRDFIETLQEKIAVDPVGAAAYAHMEFVGIHPFKDGNGRTARILENIVLKQAGYPTVPHLRELEYTKAVNAAQSKNNVGIYRQYLEQEICKITDLNANHEFDNGEIFSHQMEHCEAKLCGEMLEELVDQFNI